MPDRHQSNLKCAGTDRRPAQRVREHMLCGRAVKRTDVAAPITAVDSDNAENITVEGVDPMTAASLAWQSAFKAERSHTGVQQSRPGPVEGHQTPIRRQGSIRPARRSGCHERCDRPDRASCRQKSPASPGVPVTMAPRSEGYLASLFGSRRSSLSTADAAGSLS